MSKAGNRNILIGAGVAAVVAVAGYFVWKSQSPGQQSAPAPSQSLSKGKKAAALRSSNAGQSTVPLAGANVPVTLTPDYADSSPSTPTSVSPVADSTHAQHWTAKAKLAAKEKRWSEAVHFWTEAIQRETNYKYLTNRAAAFAALQKWRNAEEDARESLRLSGSEENHTGRYTLARAMFNQGTHRLEETLNELSHVLANAATSHASYLPAQQLHSKVQAALKERQAKGAPPMPLPSLRRQDTEEDLREAEAAAPEVHSTTFPLNHPPVSFAAIVQHKDESHTEPQRAPVTDATRPVVPAVVTPSPVSASAWSHGSFAAVVAHSQESSSQHQHDDEMRHLLEQAEAAEALRHREIAKAESEVLKKEKQQPVTPLKAPASSKKAEVDDESDGSELTESGVLVPSHPEAETESVSEPAPTRISATNTPVTVPVAGVSNNGPSWVSLAKTLPNETTLLPSSQPISPVHKRPTQPSTEGDESQFRSALRRESEKMKELESTSQTSESEANGESAGQSNATSPVTFPMTQPASPTVTNEPSPKPSPTLKSATLAQSPALVPQSPAKKGNSNGKKNGNSNSGHSGSASTSPFTSPRRSPAAAPQSAPAPVQPKPVPAGKSWASIAQQKK